MTDTNKILTIVIPTYNMERLLPRCLDSLILADEELMSAAEVLVVIDGAKDRSSEIAHSYEQRFPQTFRVIDKENGNYGSCVNRGLKEARGKYIKVLDADDSFDNDAYEQYLHALLSADADLIVTSGTNVTEDDHMTFEWKFDYEDKKTYHIEQLHHVWIHDVTHRTSLLRSIGYSQTEGISYTDEEWVFYPMFRVETFMAINVRLYRYTVGREGQTMNPANWAKSMKNEIAVSKKMYAFLNERGWQCGRAANFIREKMDDRICGFYQRALLTCALYDNEELKAFDHYLKDNCRRVYDSLDNLKAPANRFSFRYVRYWRKHDCCVNFCLNKFKLYQIWCRLKTMK